MKRFLSVEERCALSRRKSRYFTLRFFSLLAVATIMCLYAVKQVSAQVAEPAATAVQDIKPLKIGDTIPEYLWRLPLQVVNHPEGKDTITLNDYQDKKLIILDFWGAMCSPCIKSVTKLDTLIPRIGDDVAALPILTRSRVTEWSLGIISKQGWRLPSVVRDTILDREVFSRYLPDWGDVWILNGRLLAVPKSGYLNERTITKILKGGIVQFVNKTNAKPIDPLSPIFTGDNGQVVPLLETEYGVVAGYMDSYNPMPYHFTTVGDTAIIYAWNRPIGNLLYEAYQPDIHPYLPIDEAIVWRIDRSTLEGVAIPVERGFSDASAYILARERWRRSNTFGYNLRLPRARDEKAAKRIMQQDLSRFLERHLGLKVHVGAGPAQRYAVLRLLGTQQRTEELLASAPGARKTNHDVHTYRYRHYPFGKQFHLVVNSSLRNCKDIRLTLPNLIDSTGIAPSYPVTFEFSKAIVKGTTFSEIQRELARFGLYLSVEEKAVPVLIVAKK